jgi:hypothetical protein
MTPLQIFEKHPDADAYRVGGFYSPYALVAKEKRFTDAELAAEYWCAVASGEWLPIALTLNQFATLPHAHETDYQ